MPHRFDIPSSIAPPEKVEYWEDDRPMDVGDRVCFFDATATYQDVQWAKVWGEVVEMGPTHVRLKLDSGRLTQYLRRSWVFDENEPVKDQLREMMDDFDGAA